MCVREPGAVSVTARSVSAQSVPYLNLYRVLSFFSLTAQATVYNV
jgi:hypothetical protein